MCSTDKSDIGVAPSFVISGLYFSAHWCPPCRGFTPALAEYYNDWQAANEDKKFEIVFLSSDRSEDDFKGYFDEMPWAALKFGCETKVFKPNRGRIK